MNYVVVAEDSVTGCLGCHLVLSLAKILELRKSEDGQEAVTKYALHRVFIMYWMYLRDISLFLSLKKTEVCNAVIEPDGNC